MRMIFGTAIALVALLALGGAAVAQKGQSAKTNVNLQFTDGTLLPPSPYEPGRAIAGTFRGRVTAQPPKRLSSKAKRQVRSQCQRRRQVVVSERGGRRVGRTSTNGKGRFGLDATVSRGGQYVARAAKRTIRLGKGRQARTITCATGSSGAIKVG